jgi:sulfite exporter TauE/SafE
MSADVTLVSVFLVGLLGSTHCLGMCGGIVGALTLGLRNDLRGSVRRLAPYLFAYNAGRILSYVFAGAAVGAFSARLLRIVPPGKAGLIALMLSGGFMIALGLYFTGWWPGLTALERLGGTLWRRIEPLGRRLLPIDHPLKALVMGLIWGWLPCGLVYTVLVWALTTGDAGRGAVLMLVFGLGTLPAMFAAGTAARGLERIAHKPWLRQGVGVIVLGFGLFTVSTPLRQQHAPVPPAPPVQTPGSATHP